MSARKSIVSILSLTILCIAAAWAIGVQAVWAEDEPAEIVAYPVTGGNIYFVKQAGFVQELGDNCPEGIVYASDKMITEAIIPGTIEGVSVTSISNGLFSNCINLQKVSIPDSVENEYGISFDGCSNLKEIHLPNYLTSIEGYTFRNCTNLQKINIPENVKSIGANTFWGCSNLREIHLPNNLISIGNGAFFECINLQKINIPDNVKRIETNAFAYCQNLKEIHLPSSLTSIGDCAFRSTGIKRITIPDRITKIDDWTFNGSDLEEIKLPKNLKTIEECAFLSCRKLKQITLPDGLKSVGATSFGYCPFKSIIIPDSVTKIGKRAFGYNSSKEAESFYGDKSKIKDFTIKGYSEHSAAAKYAKANEFTYVNLNAPKKVSGITLKSGKRSMTVSWKKSAGASGYEILYASNKNFKSSRKVTTSGTRKTIKNLKSGKTYYVKARAYKKADGEIHYSDYCTAKKIKIK